MGQVSDIGQEEWGVLRGHDAPEQAAMSSAVSNYELPSQLTRSFTVC